MLQTAAACGLALGLALSPAFAQVNHKHSHHLSRKNPFGDIPKGPLAIVVSINQQRLHLYSNGTLIADAPVSTGVPDHPTPMGVFSIIEKDRYHSSNIYSGAPMPFMQRITWSGIAIHQGPLPGGPASHGCIRMPQDFAARLWKLTKLGARVIIARDEVAPFAFSDPHLFVRQEPPDLPLVALAPAAEPVKTAQAIDTATATDAPALQQIETDDPDMLPEDPTPIAPEDVPLPQGRPSDIPRMLALRAGPVAVFVSRKEGKIFVRQRRAPVFEAPVTIREPQRPLGTHVFTAMNFLDDGEQFRWTAITLPPEQPKPELRAKSDYRKREKGGEPEAKYTPDPPPLLARAALARIEIAPNVRDRISEMMVPGSSLTISDSGLGEETGKFTDFIVLTR